MHAADYDAPRGEPDEAGEQFISIERLSAERRARAAWIMADEADPDEDSGPPDPDLSGEELTVRVVPEQADEFTCSGCFLVCHRSSLARYTDGHPICQDCA